MNHKPDLCNIYWICEAMAFAPQGKLCLLVDISNILQIKDTHAMRKIIHTRQFFIV